uniref:Cytochrome c biogenesis protein CcsA n=1 Tax=Sonerila plagiocardia TaxID=2136678 RepID=A0A5P8GT96_9MYRT|nr:cytochrome c heme attachment protein [Sonerila plagiocardia]
MIFSTLEHILTHISFSIVSIVITIFLIILSVDEIIGLYYSSEKGIRATFLCITGLLLTRWIYSGHFPLSDLYESFVFLSWSFSLISIVPYFKKHTNYFSAITSPSTIFLYGFTTSGLLTEIHQSVILIPALQSQWLMMHVSMMIFGYAALLCGSLLSVALLVISFSFQKILKNFVNESFSFNKIQYMNAKRNVLINNFSCSARNYYRAQIIQQLDQWGYRIITLGFIFLNIGILSGSVWANEAWGSYWNWDPKETWSFITWILFAIYLHTRTNKKKFKSLNCAIVASMGFLIIWICYFGVNLLGIGLHSYGSFNFH